MEHPLNSNQSHIRWALTLPRGGWSSQRSFAPVRKLSPRLFATVVDHYPTSRSATLFHDHFSRPGRTRTAQSTASAKLRDTRMAHSVSQSGDRAPFVAFAGRTGWISNWTSLSSGSRIKRQPQQRSPSKQPSHFFAGLQQIPSQRQSSRLQSQVRSHIAKVSKATPVASVAPAFRDGPVDKVTKATATGKDKETSEAETYLAGQDGLHVQHQWQQRVVASRLGATLDRDPKNATDCQLATNPQQPTLHLDGAALGRWAVQHLERALSKPINGITGIDPRATVPRGFVSPF